MKKTLLLLFLISTIILTGCKKEKKIELEPVITTETQVLNTSSDAITTELEEYSNETQVDRPDITDVVLIDKTNSISDEDMKKMAENFNESFSIFTKEIYDFSGVNNEYVSNLNSYYISNEIYPNATTEYPELIYKTFLLNEMKSQFDSITYSDIELKTNYNKILNQDVWVVRAKGYITTKSSTKSCSEDYYHTLFSTTVVYLDNKWQIANITLAQVFKGDIRMEWQNPNNYENINVTGEFAYNSEIGIFTEEDEAIINNILNSQQ